MRQVMTSLAKLVLADTGGVGRQVTLNNLNAVADFPGRVCWVLWYGTHRFSELLANAGADEMFSRQIARCNTTINVKQRR